LKGLSRDGRIFVLETEEEDLEKKTPDEPDNQMSLKGYSRSLEMKEKRMRRYSERYSSQILMLTLRSLWKQLGLLA